MYGEERPPSERYEQACDFLDDDLASGYVRVLHEMVAAGWANDSVAVAVRAVLQGWFYLLSRVAREAAETHGGLRGFSGGRCVGPRRRAAR